jgi:hypothetical protein
MGPNSARNFDLRVRILGSSADWDERPMESAELISNLRLELNAAPAASRS